MDTHMHIIYSKNAFIFCVYFGLILLEDVVFKIKLMYMFQKVLVLRV